MGWATLSIAVALDGWLEAIRWGSSELTLPGCRRELGWQGRGAGLAVQGWLCVLPDSGPGREKHRGARNAEAACSSVRLIVCFARYGTMGDGAREEKIKLGGEVRQLNWLV